MKESCKILLKKTFYEILQVRELSHNFPVHIHNRMCIGKIDSGEKYLIINGTKRILKKNDLFYIPPFTPHSCYIKEGNTVSYTILCVDDIGKVSEKMIVNDIASASIEPDDICSLYKYAAGKADRQYNNIKIEQLLKYLNENFAKPLSTVFLADIMNFSPYYLLHFFKEKTGMSLHQYIIQLRINKTKESFLPDKNILDTALDCGFYDQSHYIRSFKRYVGITPQRYFKAMEIL